jgi:N-acetylmuramoyl-L-alanine amidase
VFVKKTSRIIEVVTVMIAIATLFTLSVVLTGNLNTQIIDVSASVEQTKQIQEQLINFGYYDGQVDGFYNEKTKEAIIAFQTDKGITPNGIVDERTAIALELEAVAQSRADIYLLAKLIHAEARGEPYIGQVAVGAVVLNRIKSENFPDTLEEVIYQPFAFTAVDDGQINLEPNESAYKAAEDAFAGWDPSYGSLFYYNPITATSAWIFTRETVTEIGKHIFAI